VNIDEFRLLHELRVSELEHEAKLYRDLNGLSRTNRRSRQHVTRWLERLARALAALSGWSGGLARYLHERAEWRRAST
jgi:hypothetical protein